MCGYVLASARTSVRTARGISPTHVLRNRNDENGDLHDTCTGMNLDEDYQAKNERDNNRQISQSGI